MATSINYTLAWSKKFLNESKAQLLPTQETANRGTLRQIPHLVSQLKTYALEVLNLNKNKWNSFRLESFYRHFLCHSYSFSQGMRKLVETKVMNLKHIDLANFWNH